MNLQFLSFLFLLDLGENKYPHTEKSIYFEKRPMVRRCNIYVLTLIRSPGIDYPAAIYVIRANTGCWSPQQQLTDVKIITWLTL